MRHLETGGPSLVEDVRVVRSAHRHNAAVARSEGLERGAELGVRAVQRGSGSVAAILRALHRVRDASEGASAVDEAGGAGTDRVFHL